LGLRGRFSYGPSSDPEAGSSFAKGTETIDFEHVLELSKTRLAGDGRLHLGIACRGAEYSQPDIWQAEYAFAREHHLPFTTHTMMTRHDTERVRAISVYAEHDVLGPGHLLIHAIHANEDEIRALAETETPVSVSILSELRVGMGIPPVVEMLRAGVNVALSLDTMAASDNSDMFAAMRTQMLVERGRFEDATIYQPNTVLRQATLDGARALGLAEVTGSLTEGKKADLIMEGKKADLIMLSRRRSQPRADQRRRRPSRARRSAAERGHGLGRRYRSQTQRRTRRLGVPAAMKAAQVAVARLSERIGKPVV